MTLTELKYVVALAQERHFGRAAQKCFVTQPTLSLALAKLEDELGIRLFERNKNEVLVTSRGQAIVEQARRVLDEVGKIQGIARGGTALASRSAPTQTPQPTGSCRYHSAERLVRSRWPFHRHSFRQG